MTRLQTSSLHLDWPGPAKISFLVRKAAGLYIWAKSAMDFILHKGGDIEERLNVICSDSGEGIDFLFFPRTISVIGSNPTSLDLSNFVHGTDWSQCFSPA